jgi:hypothetical protein
MSTRTEPEIPLWQYHKIPRVAARFDMSRQAIYARVKSGEIKARKIAGVLRIREDAVQAYLAGCK